MTLPESLPARLYLLAYDTEKNRMTAQSRLGLVLRAAALTDLYLAGRVTDENGKARATGDPRPVGDPMLDEMLQLLAAHKPRSWQGWIGHGKPAIRTVSTQLEDSLAIRVEHRRILADKVELRDQFAVRQYADELRAELRRPASRPEPRTAAVLALADRGELTNLISRAERREHRQQLDELAAATGPIADALRKAWRARQAAQASG
jgi:Golgi phosphoprotein 3 (GPP34)